MFIEFCIKTCGVTFIIACVLHRLNNQPGDDIGVKALNISTWKFIRIGVFFEILAWASQVLLWLVAEALKFEKTEAVSATVLCLTSLILMLAAIKILHGFNGEIMQEARPFLSTLKSAIYNFGLTIPVFWGTSFLWGTFLQLTHSLGVPVDLSPQDVVQSFSHSMDPFVMVIRVATAVVISPILEEIIFRGFIYRALKGRGNKFVAAGFTSFIFALIHWNLLAFAGLFMLSICLIQIYEHSADIREPILVHALLNAITIICLLWNTHVTAI
ncbi:MAG: CPBP family intramembrane metalloprotease [Puniceicoccales bacterium]|jgi:membrane protease YdiL (CAAX protease family)|nr:CPBP family intramembrane metalloprotease [Puniceicoccales bacterium]